MYEFPQNPTNNNPKIQCLSGNSHWVEGFFFGGLMRTCSVEGCEKKYYGRGYCQIHYLRWRKYGDPVFTKRHNMTESPEYITWEAMKGRCLNKNNIGYKNYGGRGITICNRWLNSFMAFYEDMGPRPFPKAQIDRIDNAGNYEPDNCQWTTSKENRRNSRTTKLTIELANQIRREYIPKIITYKILARKYGVAPQTIGPIVKNKTWV